MQPEDEHLQELHPDLVASTIASPEIEVITSRGADVMTDVLPSKRNGDVDSSDQGPTPESDVLLPIVPKKRSRKPKNLAGTRYTVVLERLKCV
jgi:hypothetical protein